MGGGGNQKISQTFDMSAINQSIYEETTINQNTSIATQANINTMNINMRNIVGCTTNIVQNIDATASSSSELNNTQTSAIKNAITTEMTAAVQAQVEKVTEAGNFQFGDKQNVNQEITLAIENIITNTIVRENINSAVSEQVSINDGVYTIDGYDCTIAGEINYTQDITAQVVATLVTDNLTDAIASSDILNQLQAAADAAALTENKGIADIIAKLFEGLTGPMKYAMIASVVCCCMVVVLAVVMGLSPAGQKATGNLSKAGAARIGGRKF
jgi:hypothetical protein